MEKLDFSQRSLKGRSFRKRELTGANFSQSDIRGCDFSEAILAGANFKGAIAGIDPNRQLILVILSIVLAAIAGFVAALAAGIFFIAFQKSLGQATLVVVFVLTPILAIGTARYGYITLASSVAIAIAIAGAGIGALLGANLGALTVALFLIVGGIGAATGAGIYGTIGKWSVLIAGIGSSVASFVLFIWMTDLLGAVVAMVISGSIEVLSGFVARNAFRGDERVAFIRERAIAFSSWGGTSFYKADLSEAQFSFATIEKTDFRYSRVVRTDFQGVEGIEQSRFEGTILQNPDVRELCVTRNGREKNYFDLNLNGACLKGANLEDANLARTQVLGTDFTNASLTGACIEGWNFNSTTQFENIDCKRIYRRCSSNGRFYEQKPDSGEFKPGHFSKWIQEVKNTVDLIFDKGLNWKAFAFSLAQSNLEDDNANLSLHSIENKEDGVVVAKVRVSEAVDQFTIHKNLVENYDRALQQLVAQNQLILQFQNEQMDVFKKLLEDKGLGNLVTSTSHKISVEKDGATIYFVNHGDCFMSNDFIDQSRSINVARDFSLEQTGSNLNLGDIEGGVTNTVEQLQSSGEPEAQTLASLLSDVTRAIHASSDLTEEQKRDALEAVATIAEEGQKKPESRAQKLSKFALSSLKSLIPIVTTTGGLAKALVENIPQISKLLGL